LLSDFYYIVFGARISTVQSVLEHAHKEKSHGFRSGEWGGHSSRLIILPPETF